MADSLQNVAFNQYTTYKNALANKTYREVEIQQNYTVRGALMTALYNNAALAGNSTNMATCLAELEEIYAEDIIPPSLVITGSESEVASATAVAVTAGIVNTISFPLSLSTNAYQLFISCYDVDGNFVSYKRYNKTTGGFDIEVADNGFIDYRAIVV